MAKLDVFDKDYLSLNDFVGIRMFFFIGVCGMSGPFAIKFDNINVGLKISILMGCWNRNSDLFF